LLDHFQVLVFVYLLRRLGQTSLVRVQCKTWLHIPPFPIIASIYASYTWNEGCTESPSLLTQYKQRATCDVARTGNSSSTRVVFII